MRQVITYLMRSARQNFQFQRDGVIRLFYVYYFCDAEFWHSEGDFRDYWFTDDEWKFFNLIQKFFSFRCEMTGCSIKFF